MLRNSARTAPGPHRTRTRGRRAAVAGLALVTTAGLVAAAGVGSAAAAPAQPSGSTGGPSWTASATRQGPLDQDAAISLSVVLNGRDAAGAEAAALAVSSPSDGRYGRFLSPAEYRARYAPTDADLKAVTSWLTDAGFTVASVPENRLYVQVTGTVAAARKAFGTGLDAWTLNGRQLHAPSGEVTLPSSVRSTVAGVAGLTSTLRTNRPQSGPRDRGDLAQDRVTPKGPSPARRTAVPAPATSSAPPTDAFVNAPPCSQYWGQKVATTVPPVPGGPLPYAPCGYTPAQIRGAYGLDRLPVSGAGVTVAIVDAYNSPTILQDANAYSAKHGLRPFAPGQFSQIVPPSYSYGYDDADNGDLCGEQGWYGEETLDVEAVHAVAPGAKVLYAGGASCLDDDLVAAVNTIVDGHRADIISNSWGGVGEYDPSDPDQAALLAAYQRVFVQAALTGIGVFYSSGDNGDETNDTGDRLADFPATHPWVTAVGGTTIGIGARNQYLFEEAWGTGRSILTDGAWTPAPPGSYLYGGGGGVSRLFAQPWYQRGVVPPSVSQYFGGKPGRAVPDVAAIGDPNTGFLVGQTQTFPDGSVKYSEYRIGGTSLSSPVAAGIEALADQASHRAHGFANPAIYELSGTPAVHDVTLLDKPTGVVRVDYVNGVDAADGTRTSLRSTQQLVTLTSRRGYDDTTGVGTPNGFWYVYGLGQVRNRVVPFAGPFAGLAG